MKFNVKNLNIRKQKMTDRHMKQGRPGAAALWREDFG